MSTTEFLRSLAVELGDYLEVCNKAYELVQEENRCLNSDSPREAYAKSDERKGLLDRVAGSMVRIKAHKALWAKIPHAERMKHMEISQLIKQNMDLIMKTVMLDRENEKLMLKHGMVPPDRLPSSAQNNPGAVAGMYQRNQSRG